MPTISGRCGAPEAVGRIVRPDAEPPVTGRRLIRQAHDRGPSLSEHVSHGIKRVGWRGPLQGLSLRKRAPLKLLAVPKDPVAGDKAAGEAILAGQLEAIDGAAALPTEVADYLHSFAWLRDLAAAATRERGAAAAEKGLRTWLARHGSEAEGEAWRADRTGQRMLFWTAYAPYLLSGDDAALRADMLGAMALGARHLTRVAHRSAPGLPRITAWSGLTAAALLLQGGPARLPRSEKGLARALAEALHEDGGLISRAPEEQLALVDLLAQLRAVYLSVGADLPEAVDGALEHAPAALLAVTLGDGALGHWQGSGTASARRVAAAVEGTGGVHKALRLAHGWGYQRIEARGTLVVVDAAPPPPLRAARHGCASTLAFEMSDGAHRLIVNCGGGRHAAEGLAAPLRTSAAHSTLVLADRNSTAVEEDGTLGKGVIEVELVRDADGGVQKLEASHDGYVRRSGLLHRRLIEVSTDGLAVSGEDRLEPRGKHKAGWRQVFAVRFHLAPGVEATSTADGKGALLRVRGGHVWQFRCRGGSLLGEDSLWIDADGRPQQTQQLVISGETGPDGAAVSWSLRRAG
jgi:uncharacterized heparinase superfamily protein